MKIGVNIRPLCTPFTGVGQYIKNLFLHLGEIDKKNEYLLLAPGKVPESIGLNFPSNIKIVFLPEKKRGNNGMKKTWWEQIQVPEYFEKEKVDIAFFPYPCNPWAKSWYSKKIKTIVTVHDCIPWTHKDYRRGILSKMYHSQTKKAVGKADMILTVSGASKKDIIQICDVPQKKIKVIYPDAADEYKGNITAGLVKDILNRFELSGKKYFIYAGGYDKRKNAEYLLEEYEKFAEIHKGIDLVLAGGKLFDDRLYNSFDNAKSVSGRIIRTGFLSEKELHALYHGALSFVHFSLMEGFNIPILEAANSGLPLILSDIPVHREVAGDGAIFADVSEKGAGAAAMEKIMDSEAFEKYSKKSLEAAEKFSWEKSAKEFQDVLSL